MAEYKCPECGGKKTKSEKNLVNRLGPVRMILCEDCGSFLGVVNDTSGIEAAIKDVRQAIKASTGL